MLLGGLVNLGKWLTTLRISSLICELELVISTSLGCWKESMKEKLEKPFRPSLAHTAAW